MITQSINGPLQKRTKILDLDLSRSNDRLHTFDDRILESEWTNSSLNIFFLFHSIFHVDLFLDGNKFSWRNPVQDQNTFYQKQLADQINVQMVETFQLLTSTLNVHLTEDRTMIMNT